MQNMKPTNNALHPLLVVYFPLVVTLHNISSYLQGFCNYPVILPIYFVYVVMLTPIATMRRCFLLVVYTGLQVCMHIPHCTAATFVLPVCLSNVIYQPINQPVHLPTYQPTCPFTNLPTNLSIYQPTNQPVHLPTYQPTCPFTNLPTNLSIYNLPTNLSIYQPTQFIHTNTKHGHSYRAP